MHVVALTSSEVLHLRKRKVPLRVVWCCLFIVGIFSFSGCTKVDFYDVTATPQEDCVVTPAGEFCGDVGGPVQNKYTVEFLEGNTAVYFDEEMWLAAGTEGERVVVKEEKTTQDCTVTHRRVLRFNIDSSDNNGPVFRGSFEETTRIEGPSVCGDTPNGSRLLYSLEGYPSSSF